MDISKLRNPISKESCESRLNDILSNGDTDIETKLNDLNDLLVIVDVLLESEVATQHSI